MQLHALLPTHSFIGVIGRIEGPMAGVNGVMTHFMVNPWLVIGSVFFLFYFFFLLLITEISPTKSNGIPKGPFYSVERGTGNMFCCINVAYCSMRKNKMKTTCLPKEYLIFLF